MVSPETDGKPDQDAVEAAKHVISSLLLAVKMSSLYPEDHPLYKTAITSLQDHLDTFLEVFGELEFQVEKTQLLFEGEVVHKGEARDGDLAFALFRDGITALVFQDDWEPWEIRLFVGILRKYKSISEEAEGDIVTAMWEAELPHIQYESAEHILEADLETEISMSESNDKTLGRLLPVKEGDGPSPLDTSGGDPERVDSRSTLSTIDLASTALTHEEIGALVEMTRLEEERDAIREILNIMSDLLIGRQDERVCDVVFQFLEEELHSCFSRKDFDVTLRILKGLRKIYSLCEETQPLSRSRIKELFNTASSPDFLAPLNDVFPTMSATDIEKAKEVLLLLPSKAIRTLTPMITDSESSLVRKMLSDVVVTLAAGNADLIVEALNKTNDDSLHLIVPILGRLEDDKSSEVLIELVSHKSEKVRVEALRAIMARDLWIPERIGPLTDDESELIRELQVEYFGSRRSESAETVLLSFLQKQRLRNKEISHLSPYIRALGRCGSANSVPFLKSILLRGGLVSRFRESALRETAAYALRDLETKESVMILENASQSRFAGIRSSAQKVIEDQGSQGDQ
jgi:HEAT repeat protein